MPRSSKLIYEDKDYCLFSVTLFKRVADSFKAAARTKGFQVRSLGGFVVRRMHALLATSY